MNLAFKLAIAGLGILALGSCGYFAFKAIPSAEKVNYRLGEVKHADLVSAISATGTLEPEELVDVGAQITGQILSFGKDRDGKTVDYCSYVKAGTVLTNIDDSTYAAEAESSDANLKVAEASLANAKADLNQMKAKLDLALADMDRAERLKNSTMSKADYDTYKAALAVARANLAVGETKILGAEATLLQSKATLKKALRNLSYCTICSPVDGVVIDRRVNIGQTVVSSMSTSSLFLIAKDIRKMQLWASVNEADIGRIKPGQTANFTIDAFPGEVFPGKVSKIRLNATMTQNVVTYTVEVTVDNSSGRLLPYLTGNVVFETDRINNALTVPNAALRWSPKDSFASNEDSAIWTLEKDLPKRIPVKVISTDGSLAALEPEDSIREGMPVILGQLSSAAIAKNSSNPFVPKFKKRNKQQGPPPP